MSVVPGDLETDLQPPMTVPLRHFLVGLSFLILGVLLRAGVSIGIAPNVVTPVHVHLLLVGWICLTIMGAMTQFVPVWAGVRLRSRRLASVQLWLVVLGLLGLVTCFGIGALSLLPVFGGLMLVGFWLFVYNVGRPLLTVPTLDVTERHFAIALGFFLLVTVLGVLLAVDFTRPVFAPLGTGRVQVVRFHATVAVFGAILTTVLGALYQLATMFTQTELHGVDVVLRRFEEVGYPTGVVLLAGGRLLDVPTAARLGGLLVAFALLGFGVILGRRLFETGVDWTPMLSKYAVVAAALPVWAAPALVAWLRDPLAEGLLFGAPGTAHALLLGVIGFVVLGTLYHVVPFIVWVHRYSDRLGYESVPMNDDLYDDRIAAVDFWLLLGGTVLVVAADRFAIPSIVTDLGGFLVLVGAICFLVNMVKVVRVHSPHTLLGVLTGIGIDSDGSSVETTPSTDAD